MSNFNEIHKRMWDRVAVMKQITKQAWDAVQRLVEKNRV